MWILADIGRTGMFLAGVVLLVLILLRRTYRYYGRRKPRKAAESYLAQTPRPESQRRSLSTAPTDVLGWQVEMHETARELKAELDSKMRSLQLLIAQARHESDRLERNLSRLESPARDLPDARPSTKRSSWLPGSPDRQAEIFTLADQGRSAADIAQQVDLPLGEIELILSLRGARGNVECRTRNDE